jgi:hypothetical protein
MTSSLLFYKNPTPLDKNKHSKHRLKKQSDYSFAATTNSVPVAGFEFFQASRHFPVFFLKNKEGNFVPVAVLSFRKDGHDLGDTWNEAYVPAYIRRYPFVLSQDRMVLFDADAPHIQEQEGERLFNDDGENTEFTNELLKFLEQVDAGYRATEEFCKAASEKGLIEPFKGELKFKEGSLKLNDLHSIDEKKLMESLSESEVNDWFKRGWLAWAYAHLHSIGSIDAILKRARVASEAQTAANS